MNITPLNREIQDGKIQRTVLFACIMRVRVTTVFCVIILMSIFLKCASYILTGIPELQCTNFTKSYCVSCNNGYKLIEKNCVPFSCDNFTSASASSCNRVLFEFFEVRVTSLVESSFQVSFRYSKSKLYFPSKLNSTYIIAGDIFGFHNRLKS